MATPDIEKMVLEEYLLLRNVKKVAKKLGMSVGIVRRILLSVCGPLYGLPGLCRLYIYMNGRCFASFGEAAKALGVSVHDIYYLASRIAESRVGIVVERSTAPRRTLYLLWDTEECRRMFSGCVDKE